MPDESLITSELSPRWQWFDAAALAAETHTTVEEAAARIEQAARAHPGAVRTIAGRRELRVPDGFLGFRTMDGGRVEHRGGSAEAS